MSIFNLDIYKDNRRKGHLEDYIKYYVTTANIIKNTPFVTHDNLDDPRVYLYGHTVIESKFFKDWIQSFYTGIPWLCDTEEKV